MGKTTFTGPITAGNVLNTTGTTPGYVANVGWCLLMQEAAITQSATAAATTIVIPAGSVIKSIDLFATTAWSGTETISVGISSAANELASGISVSNVGITSLNPGTSATLTGNWLNTGGGTTDVIIYVASGTPGSPAGAGTLVVTYAQAITAG